MSQISVSHLSFSYDTSAEPIFSDVSFELDTDWKLGFIGRNGRGKTTFLNLLLGKFSYSGTITASVSFEYFPFPAANPTLCAFDLVKDLVAPFRRWEQEMERLLSHADEDSLTRYGEIQGVFQSYGGYEIEAKIHREAAKLELSDALLSRRFDTLSLGEQTKVLLAGLFLKENRFLLIDEPTNHLDIHGRRVLSRYLNTKQGFLLVSHDRAFLNGCIDHTLSINRADIEVLRGNFDTWQRQKDLRDHYELARNERLKTEIRELEQAKRRTAGWSDAIESSKKGTRIAGLRPDRGFIGRKAAKMMKQAKSLERRQQTAIEEKNSLLKNLEQSDALKLHVLEHPKQRLVEVQSLSIDYGNGPLFPPVSFAIQSGERVSLSGRNGSGKSSILKLLLGENIPHTGQIRMASGMQISYVAQDTSHLSGTPAGYAEAHGLDRTLFFTVLRKLGFARSQFELNTAQMSGGQKKKILLAAGLCTPAHLFVLDEPLNFIDIISRMQIEQLILQAKPTLLFIEHDETFCAHIATRQIVLAKREMGI